jgi:F0F1-type ATP synthase assembly protein I
MIFGLLGWLLDGRFSTRPIFMLVFFAFVLGYVIWKHHGLYSAAMDAEQRKLTGPRSGAAR